MNEAEKKIYDEFEAGGRALLAKAKADAAAIGVDVQTIIGNTEKAVVKEASKVANFFKYVWSWIISWTSFLDDPRTTASGTPKFSHKRLMALGAFVIGARQLIIGDKWGALGCGVFALIEAIVAAVSKT